MPLITAKEFDKLVFRAFGKRKPELNDIISEIEKYHSDFEADNLHGKYNQLKAIRSVASNYLSKYPNSSRNKTIQEVLFPSIEQTVIELQQEETVVPKKLHFVWIGGNLTNVASQYIALWTAVNADYNTAIWYDSRVLLANTLKRAILDKCYREAVTSHQDAVLAQTYTHDDFIRDSASAIYEERKKIFNLYNEKKETATITDIIIEFLTSETYGYGRDAEELKAVYDEALEAMVEREAKDVSTTDLLTANELETLYFREVMNYQNLAAASDMLRMAVLVKEGGYYLDVDMLPATNNSLFRPILDNLDLTTTVKELVTLEAIMKGMPDLIPGYSTHYYDNLSEEVRTSLQESVENNKDITKLFIPLRDITCSPMTMKIYGEGRTAVGNNALISHPDSILGKLIIKNMIANYAVMDEFMAEYVRPEQTYKEAVAVLVQGFVSKVGEMLKISPQYEYISKVIDYLSVGITIDATATISLTGPGNLSKSIYNYFLPAEVEYGFITEAQLNMIRLGDNKVSAKTEEELRSGWVLRRGAADERFKSIKQNLIEGALDYDQELDFNEWSMPETESLTERITANNWVSARSDVGRIIIQMQGDSISKEAASNLFSKYASRAMYVVNKPEGVTTYSLNSETNEAVSSEGIVIPDILNDKSEIIITVVGHGGGTEYSRSFANMTANQLDEALKPFIDAIESKNFGPKSLRVNLLGCRMYSSNEPVGTSYPEQLLVRLYQRLTNEEIWARKELQVSANEFDVRINSEGKKEILDYSGQWVVKEQVMLQDQLGKCYFRYNETTQHTEKLTNDPSVLIRVLNNVHKNLIDPDQSAELKTKIFDGFLVGIQELKAALKWKNQPTEGSQTNQRINRLFKAIQLTEELSKSLSTVFRENHLTDENADYYFDLDSVAYNEETNEYTMRVFDLKSDKIVAITDTKPIFIAYKSLLNEQIEEFKKGIDVVTDSNMARKIKLSSTQHTNTLNAAFFLQSVLDFKTQYNNIHNLDKAVRVQIYSQIFRNGVGVLQTAADVSRLISEAAGVELKLLNGVSDGLSAAAVIFDGVILTSLISELKSTSDARRHARLQTQIGIISANLALNAGSIGAGMAGAATAASILGYLTVPVAGLSIGLPTLLDNLYVLRESYLDTVRYFGYLFNTNTIYTYDEEKKAAIPADDIVITDINFKNKKYSLGNCDMYAMNSGSGHTSSEIDTFFTAPKPIRRGKRIPVYQVLGIKPFGPFPDQDVVVLPGALNRRLDYEMTIQSSVDISVDSDDQLLLYGLQALNNIKFAYKGIFYWRYYAPPGYWGISRLKSVYFPTDIKVQLDNKTRTLIIPHHTITEARYKLKYSITGGGGQYAVIMPPDASNVRIILTAGDVFTVNVDHLIYQTEIGEDGSIQTKDDFVEESKRLKYTFQGSRIRTVSFGGTNFTFEGDLNNTVYFHFMVAGEKVQMLLAVDFRTNHITVSLVGSIENIIENKDKIITAINALNLSGVNDSMQFISPDNKVSGCVCLKEDNLIVAAVITEEDVKKVYTVYGNAEEQDSAKYSYVEEKESDISVQIKDDTVIVHGDYSYEDEKIQYTLSVSPDYSRILTSLYLNAKATESLMTKMNDAEDKKGAITEWLLETTLSASISNFAISDYFVISSMDKNNRYVEYTLTVSEDVQTFKSHFGKWAEKGTQFTIFDNGKSHLIISQSDIEDMYDNIFDDLYIKSKMTENLYIDDIIVIPSRTSLYVVIEPDASMPVINISNAKSEKKLIIVYDIIDNFVWNQVDNDLILFNNEENPKKSTVKLRFMDVFNEKNSTRYFLKFTKFDSEEGPVFDLPTLMTVMDKGDYIE